MKVINAFFCACLVILIPGCKRSSDTPVPLKDKLLNITTNYISKHDPASIEQTKLPPIIVDQGDHWEVSFELPKNDRGGGPAVNIDKSTYKVLGMHYYQ
jgi:hypothetical protein